MRPAFLFERCRVLQLTGEAMLEDPEVAALDPHLESVRNLNEPADYQRAHGLPAPEVKVRRFGPLAQPDTPRLQTVRAWSLGDAAATVGLALDQHVVAALNGDQITRDPYVPLAAGDAVAFMVADAGG